MVGVGLNRLVTAKLVEWFSEVSMADSATVGGKGSSLGELYCNLTTAGVRVPNGFNVTVEAFQQFVNTEVFRFNKNIECVVSRQSIED